MDYADIVVFPTVWVVICMIKFRQIILEKKEELFVNISKEGKIYILPKYAKYIISLQSADKITRL